MKNNNYAIRLSNKEIKLIPKSFDVIGDILIFSHLPKELEKKEKIVGEYLIRKLRNVKVIGKSIQEHKGVFRTRKIKIIAGEKRKETKYKESGIIVKLNVEKCYFSPRLSNERLRIVKLIKKNELVLVMFSGVGIYPLIISKNSKAKEIYGIELNKVAHDYAIENLKLNKINNIRLYNGDVNLVLPRIKKRFDRIIMPLPKNASDFLDIVIKKIKTNGVIHLYDFQEDKDIPKATIEKVRKVIKKIKIIRIIKCGQYGPRKYRVCFDFKVL